MALGLFGSSSGSSAAPITAAPVDQSSKVKEELKAQIAQELAVANATELVNKITSNCFEKCMGAPYSYKDEPCVDKCLEKYMRAWNAVSKTYIQRIQQASR